MANTLNIPERTLAQVSSSTNSINVVGGVDGRLSVYEPLVVRITDHQDDVASATDEPTDMAIFCSIRHGEPWKKDCNVVEHIVQQAGVDTITDNVSVLFPAFDYTTFG